MRTYTWADFAKSSGALAASRMMSPDITSYCNQQYAHWVTEGGVDEEWDAYIAQLERMSVQDLIAEDLTQDPVFHRTEIVPMEGSMAIEEIPDWLTEQMKDVHSVLMICNTKKEAQQIFKGVRDAGFQAYHMSASMCTDHRREVLQRIRASIIEGQHVICVSTQVMQAGIDISFDRVVRVSAGMDSVIQAAGRCNRNGELHQPSIVTIMRINGENLKGLPDIAEEQNATERLISKYMDNKKAMDGDLSSQKAISAYYNELYGHVGEKTKYWLPELERYMYGMLSDNYQWTSQAMENKYVLHQAFKSAGERFNAFDQDGLDVLVPYGNGLEYIERLKEAEEHFDYENAYAIIKELKGFTVNIFEATEKKIAQMGGLHQIERFGIYYIDTPFYHQEFGICIPDTTDAAEGFWG